MTATTKELTDYARFLRNAAPQEFINFYGAFAKYTENMIESLVFGAGDLSRAQGSAQQCLNILRVLEGVKNE
jgi:hypothetical protein